ncbi:MAG: 2Fe-2S iron-sulfur cluster-binding protein, partial [Acidobacteria bacterium]|nr:2Fe-2S iron-sulfur cluster-binding protein [Acidobacteriota bacterium]MDW7983074.1 2Fe-2S iron-sulfur cluster-binding protein [Acidobacteriota bacterium]
MEAPKKVTITIDGRTIETTEGLTIIQVADQVGIPIPRYCYHPGLSIVANCRICLVRVEKIPKLVPACATPVQDGMVVSTNTEDVVEARRSVLEFLLLNHPVDCPVCDRSG